MASRAETAASGAHGREEFIRVFFVLYRSQYSGILDVQFGKKTRKLYFLGGSPVAYRSDLPEDDLGRTLANANLIPEKQINYFREKLSEGEALEHAIVMSGALTATQISEHVRSRLQTSVGSPLLWGSGTWAFTPHPTINVGGIDPGLRPDSSALAALWHAVEQHVSMDAVFPTVTDPKAGMVALDPLCGALFSRFEVDEAFAELPNAVGNGCSVEEVFRKIPDSSGNLVKLLWFLEAAGLVHRQGRPQDNTVAEILRDTYDAPQRPPRAQPPKEQPPKEQPKKLKPTPPTAAKQAEQEAEPAPGAKKKRPPLTDDQIRAAHRKRMGRDFYAFLGLPPGAPQHAIDRKCKGLARRWRIPGKQRELPADVQDKVDELLASVQLVWRTLTDDKHREEYDRRQASGRAPKVGDLKTAASAPKPAGDASALQEDPPGLNPEHRRARDLMNGSKFKEALALLKKVRVDDPSNPDIMADLGWTTWKIQGAKNGDAEEFLRLALTFDDRHLFGLEYLAKVLVEKGDLETALVLVQRLLKLNPSSKWAKTAIKNLNGGA